VTFANPLPLWALAVVVLLAGLVAWLAYRRFAAAPSRRALLIGLRIVTLLLLVVFLMRPVARRTGAGVRDAVVPVLVDVSRSMSIEDGSGQPRIDRARALLSGGLSSALQAEFDLDVLAFGDEVAPTPVEGLSATARRSDLGGALADLAERYRGRPVAGVVLLSDGGDTGGVDLALGTTAVPPVFAIGIGAEQVGRDREVLSVTAAESVLDDSRVELAVSVVSHGYGTEPVALQLLENGRPIAVRRVMPAGEGVPARETFQVTPPDGGPAVYTVQIPAASGELVPENNARSALVQPPARARRVLLVEGAPGFEHSFMKRAWAGDRGLEVDSAVRKGTNDQGSDTFYIQAARGRGDALASGYPRTREELFAYDAIVLGNVGARQFGEEQLEATRAFVGQRGGGLLVLGARSFLEQGLVDTPLEEVLPLDLSERGGGAVPAAASRGLNRLVLTDSGAGHPVMQLGGDIEATRKRWDGLPALAGAAPLGGPRPGASVLATTAGPGGSARALVAVQRYGEGRAMVFTGEASWRWRMLQPSTDRSYDTFWRQAVRWVALPAAEPIALRVPAGAAPGDTLPLTVVVRDAAFEPLRDAIVDVNVTSPDGRIERMRAAVDAEAPGHYAARFSPPQPGVYRVTAEVRRGTVRAGTATAAMLVGGADLEMTDPRLNRALLQRVASGTGGQLLREGDTAPLLEALRARVPAAPLTVRRDLWHNAWSFLAIVALLGLEWGLRRRWGLR
jgi:uncharacterized membrane protein